MRIRWARDTSHDGADSADLARGLQVEVDWECEYDEEILSRHSELKTHRVVRHSQLNTRDALYGGRTEAMSLQYKIR